MLPSGPVMTSFGWLNWFGPEPGCPGVPSDISSSPSGLNLCTWCPLVPSALPTKSVTQTLLSASTWMPCGVTMTPPPKFASTSPVWRSNLKIGSTGLLSQLTGTPPPKLLAPQRS